jgi:hypothetical protein
MNGLDWLKADTDAGDDLDSVQRAIRRGGQLLDWVACAAGETEDGMSRFIASTGDVDRHGDVVEQSWRLANYKRNPVIMWEHGRDVVGRGTVKVETVEGVKSLMLSVKWDESEINPLGMLAAHQHRARFRSTVSVGFMPGETLSRAKLPDADPRKVGGDVPEWRAGYVYRYNELLEVSSVGVPANASAVQLRELVAEVEDPEAQVLRFLRETTHTKLRQILVDASQSNPGLARAVRSIVLGQPAPTHNGALPFLKGA